MKLADSNVWLALSLLAHEHHSRVSTWLLQQAAQDVAFCRMTQLALLRLLTTRAVLNPYGNPPLTNQQAWDLYNGLLADQRITHAPEPPGLEKHWKGLAQGLSASPKPWMDAYLAAFAIAGGYQLIAIDTAFTQFKSLDLVLLQ